MSSSSYALNTTMGTFGATLMMLRTDSIPSESGRTRSSKTQSTSVERRWWTAARSWLTLTVETPPGQASDNIACTSRRCSGLSSTRRSDGADEADELVGATFRDVTVPLVGLSPLPISHRGAGSEGRACHAINFHLALQRTQYRPRSTAEGTTPRRRVRRR